MLQKKSQRELTFIVLSFICMSALTILMTHANQLKEELREEKESLEENNSKLKENLSNKSVEIDELNDNIESLNNSLDEQVKQVKELKEDNKKLNKDNEKLNNDVEKKEEKIEELTQLSAQKKNEEKTVIETKAKKEQKTVANSSNGYTKTMEITAYTAFCDTGCIGITAAGTDVSNTIYHPSGYRVVAVDPNVIPLGTLLNISGETYIADDTGGDIKGNRLDILVNSKSEALQFGRQKKEVTIIN